MGLEFAIEELYATGWTALDSAGCVHHSDGRMYPSLDRAGQECRAAGFDLAVRHVPAFGCYQAQLLDKQGTPLGSVVGQSEHEAAVYALAQLRRHAVQPA